MNRRNLTLAAIQMNCAPFDKAANVERAIGLIETAVEKGAELMVLPELFTMGFYIFKDRNPDFFDMAEPIPGPTTEAIGRIAKKHGVYIVAPVFERLASGVYHNTAPLIGPDGVIIGKYSKTHVPPRPEEKFYFSPGSEFPVFPTEIGKIGMVICYDREFPEPIRVLSLKGAEMVMVPSVIFPRDKASYPDGWILVNRARSYDSGVFGVFVNRGGKESGKEYFGHSMIVNPNGKVLAQAGFDECVITASIDLEDEAIWRRRRAYDKERRPEMYSKIVEPRKGQGS
ncbi:MAG: acyltransferase [Candidatus Bathyarchaeota archaeon]|nr:acyltransferase [Candidatus Bathyarchaeota archaeon]